LFDEAGQLPMPLNEKLAGWRRWKSSNCRTAGLLTLLVALQLAGAVLVPLDATPVGGFWDYLALGTLGGIVAPPTLLAMWTVFGPGRAAVRLPATLWLIGAFALCVAAGVARTMCEYDVVDLFLISASGLIAFFTLQLPLWVVRAARRWRFELAAGERDPSQTKPSSQFTLRDLLGWTLAAASLLAAARSVLGVGVLGLEPDEMADSLMIGGLMSLLIALAGLPIVALAWILLAGGRRPLLRTALSVLTLTGTPAGVWLCTRLTGFDGVMQAVCIEAGTIAIGIVNLAVIWACGYRLNRRERSSVVFRSAKERSFAELKTTLDEPRQASAQVSVGGWRFSLALASLLLIAAGLGWSVPHRRETWRQAAIYADWQRSNVNVSFDESGKLTGAQYLQVTTVSENTLRRIARLNDLESLDLSHSAIDDRQLALLAPLAARLRELTLSGTNVTDAGLKELARFHELDYLELTNTRITDAGLAHLKSLAVLRTLHLDLTDVTDAALLTLAQLPSLQILDVELTAVSERAAATFEKEHPEIMVEFGASDAQLFKSFSVTPWMVVSPNGAIGTGSRPPSAKRLHAQGRRVTDKGISMISWITDLEELDLRDSAVTDAGLTALTGLLNLRRLDVRGSAVTDRGVARLGSALTQCEIVR
jgi:internalin A